MALIFLVCLISSPDTCREERLSFAFEPVSDLGCMVGAQPKMAEWTNTHPGWQIARWECVPFRLEENRTI
jgi:hypothetical protein